MSTCCSFPDCEPGDRRCVSAGATSCGPWQVGLSGYLVADFTALPVGDGGAGVLEEVVQRTVQDAVAAAETAEGDAFSDWAA